VSWRRVAAIYAALVLLAAWVLAFERDTPVPEPNDVPGPASAESLLGADASAVAAVRFTRHGETVRAERADDRWRAVGPRGTTVSPDLIDATVATLTAGQPSERLAPQAEDDLAAYGLDAPTTSVDVVLRATPDRPITVLIGGRNPTQTAVYARRTDQPAIFLVGLNVSYYIDLIFEAAAG
jgi:hypothetical protein